VPSDAQRGEHPDRAAGALIRALEEFGSGHSRVLVATDVAARGLHVDDVDLVVHFDPANDHKDYLHRSGRTARAGAAGTVVSFVEPGQHRDVAKMHEAAKVAPKTETVHSGHPAVRAIAESGEPIVVVPLPTRSPQPTTSTRPARSAGSRGRAPRRHRGAPPRRISA